MKIDDEVEIGSNCAIDRGSLNFTEIKKGVKIDNLVHIAHNVTIGKNCVITAQVGFAGSAKIGNNVKIQNNVSVYEGVELEDYVFCGPSMVFTNIKVPRSEFPQKGKEYYSKTIVKKSASIGANATIICGITIGEYSLIGSGAVVTKDVPPFSLVIGNPGRIVCILDKKGNRIK